MEQVVNGQCWACPDETEPRESWDSPGGDGKTPSALKESSNIALQENKDELTVSCKEASLPQPKHIYGIACVSINEWSGNTMGGKNMSKFHLGREEAGGEIRRTGL